jgi:hypothetical protein
VAIIDSAGLISVSFYKSDSTWTDAILLNPASSYQYTINNGSTNAVIWADGLGVTITENASAGTLDVNVPPGVELLKVNVQIPSGAVDNDNNYYINLNYSGLRTYNTMFLNLNLPNVMVSSAETASMSRNSPVLFSPDGNAGVDVGVSAFGGGDGSDLEIALKDFLLSSQQFVTLNFSTQ